MFFSRIHEAPNNPMERKKKRANFGIERNEIGMYFIEKETNMYIVIMFLCFYVFEADVFEFSDKVLIKIP